MTNHIFSSVNLTIEKETDKCLPFLDVMVHRSEDNSVIWTDVYYKPSSPLQITAANSHTSKQHLNNSILPLFRRAITHTSFQYLENKEKQKIFNLAIMKGYSENQLFRLQNTANRAVKNRDNAIKNKKLKYIGAIQYNRYLYAIVNAFKAKGYGIAYKSVKLKQFIVNDRDDESITGGVYKIPINTEGNNILYYIGRTRRDLKTRIKEHKNSLNNFESSTALKEFLHTNKTAYPLWNDSRLICKPNTDKKLEIREKITIWKYGDNAININKDIELQQLWKPIL